MNNNVSVAATPAVSSDATMRDPSIGSADGNVAPSGQQKFAAVLNRVKADEPEARTDAAASPANSDKPVACADHGDHEDLSDDDKNDASNTAAMELLLLMTGNSTPPAPPTAPVPAATANGTKPVGAATELQAVAGNGAPSTPPPASLADAMAGIGTPSVPPPVSVADAMAGIGAPSVPPPVSVADATAATSAPATPPPASVADAMARTSAPSTPPPAPVLDATVGVSTTEVQTAASSDVVAAATELQSVAGKLPGMTTTVTADPAPDSASTQVQSSGSAQAQPQVQTPPSPNRTEDQAVPAWLLKGVADAPDAVPEKQALLELGQSMARMLDRSEDRASDNKRMDVVAGTDVNVAATLSVLGSAAGAQTVMDWKAVQQMPHVLHAPVGSAGWAAELGSKLVILGKQETPVATLHVTPADLGPIQVRIETQQNQANVWFTAGHADTRSALEQSLPKLRELFAAQGLQLNDAGVFGDRSSQQAPYQSQTSPRWATSRMDTDIDMGQADTVRMRTLSLNMVDTYA